MGRIKVDEMSKALTKIQLVGARAYSYKGMKFARNKHYLVPSDRARLLLKTTTDVGMKIFKEVGKPFEPMAREPEAPPVREMPVVDTTREKTDVFEEELLGEDDDDIELDVELMGIDEPGETEPSDAPDPAADEEEGGIPV